MRKINNKRWVFTVAVLIVINLITLSFLWFSRSIKKDHVNLSDEFRVERYLRKELNLNEEQIRFFKGARREHFKSIQTLTQDMHSARVALTRLLAEEPDTAAVEELIRAVVTKQAELERYNFQHLRKLRSVCNEVQKPKFDSVMLKVVNRMQRLRHARHKRKKRPE
ncbi:periplasmic heavy metal sensor [Fulvivirga sp. M361]|uniref:Spy/CpxP family protein refolding chaperone n=1 Tax=Fulvivirga sp. M361 TaxID=2594266 RepID=UPI00117B487A|nr:periplasmic heavy metal sensor [Fulvivirga sp. M361]TRX57748.1 periplasmic heavy metal sensor [Fulvivirga sp. M361]